MRRASVVDTVRVGLSALAPIVAQGVILRRPRLVALVERLDADRRAARLLYGLRHRYGSGLLRLRLPGRSLALVLSAAEVRRVLSDTGTYAPANREKVAALTHFQPHGVLVSDGPVRERRRRFTESVLDTGQPVHRLGDVIEATVRQELDAADLSGTLTWDRFSRLWWRVVRRIVLGHGARDDEHLIRMLNVLRADANWAYLRPRRTGLRRCFEARLRGHLDRAEPGSLAGVLAETPAEPDVDPAGQVPHWLFAFDAAGIAAYRALALLASATDARADPAYLQAAVLESVRLWPTTLVLLRDSTAAVDGAPAGTGYLIVTSFFQRARGECFDPDLWLSGRADEDWALVPFSRGPARCPGRELVLFTTGTMLAALRERYALTPLSAPANHAALRFSVSARARSPVPG